MQIIQISDMHINQASSLEQIKEKIENLFTALKPNLRNDDCTVICILGDLVDKGDATKYKDVLEVLNYIKSLFVDFNPTFEFTPGNHDLCNCPHKKLIPEICDEQKCSLDNFVELVKNVDKDYTYESIMYKEYPEIDLVLVNSVFHKNCKFGLADIESFKDIVPKKPVLLLMHHTFLSENDNDVSAMRNAYKMFEVIEEKEIIGVLHGHTHGYKDITVGKNCPIIGVGPFLKDIANVNNQVNLVIATETGISKVINYYYREDRSEFLSDIVFTRMDNVYKGNSIKKTYGEILHDTKNFGIIPNMNLHICMLYQNFNKEIEELFPEKIHLAELWQQTEGVPDSLHYNHGQYMQYKGTPAINFVIDELKSKATSSRAIIPLINFEQVVNSGDSFLPSFDIVQFGFQEEDKKQLYVTLYLRALEVNHFLKINLCEIYLMCKKIYEQIRSIDSIDITVIAFRAQYKSEFGCFKRAIMDSISQSKILLLLQNNIKGLVDLLIEKRNLYETVIETNGMNNLLEASKALHETKQIRADVLKQVKQTLDVMEKLKVEREKTSNYDTIKPLEKNVVHEFDKIIELFKGGLIYES